VFIFNFMQSVTCIRSCRANKRIGRFYALAQFLQSTKIAPLPPSLTPERSRPRVQKLILRGAHFRHQSVTSGFGQHLSIHILGDNSLILVSGFLLHFCWLIITATLLTFLNDSSTNLLFYINLDLS
jgi:hypothetical protein